jgi:hypothetical protein
MDPDGAIARQAMYADRLQVHGFWGRETLVTGHCVNGELHTFLRGLQSTTRLFALVPMGESRTRDSRCEQRPIQLANYGNSTSSCGEVSI